MRKLAFILFLVLLPVMAIAQTMTTTTSTIANPNELFGVAFTSFKDGAWGAGIGAVLMLFVAVGRGMGFLNFIPKKAVPWTTMGMAMALSVGAGLVASAVWTDILQAGFNAGVVAIGGWETLGKMIRDKVKK